MLEKLKEFICDFANISPDSIDENTDLRNEAALDSISLLNLAVALEDEFGVELTQENMKDVKTVGDFLKYIEDNK